MRLVMVGISHATAPVAARERFTLDRGAVVRLLPELAGGEVNGCALLATCNRSELYLSHSGDVPPDGVALLCRALGAPEEDCRPLFTERAERQAAEHLMRVAAGMESAVPGDRQIVSQIRDALDAAREAGCADALLEALFRAAVTAGKKVRTEVRFAPDGASAAAQAAAALEKRLGNLAGRRALVVGNGVVALGAARALAAAGCAVEVTHRDHRRPPELPPGCRAVAYDDRYRLISGRDAVISATSGPGWTIAAAALEPGPLPALFVDLAVPRDIDPEVGRRAGVTLLNIDDLRPPGEAGLAARLAEAGTIAREAAARFEDWRRARRRFTGMRPGAADFPLFVNLHGATVLMAGGGRVAARRCEKLLAFGARVLVVSPEAGPEMRRLLGRDGLAWRRDVYRPDCLDGVTLAIAATDDREVNRRIGEDARARGILVSVADRREECSFYFPAIVRSDCFTAGLISNHGDHNMVRQAADRVLAELETVDEDCARRQP